MCEAERIENKKTELMQIFSELPEKKLKVAADLISQAAFMAVTLEDLAKSISEHGTVEEYTNGANQSGRKVSSEAKYYNSLIAKYTAITTKLLQLIPKDKKAAPIPKRAPAPTEYEPPAAFQTFEEWEAEQKANNEEEEKQNA